MGHEPYHHFDPYLAQKYGVNEAIFLSDVAFWVQYNQKNNKNFYDGHYWTYNTTNAICERHFYWTRHQVERIIKKLSECGAILIGNYNSDPRDRTNWYSLGYDLYEYFYGNLGAEDRDCIPAKAGIHSRKSGDPFPQKRGALPDNTTTDNIQIYKNTFLSKKQEKENYGFGLELEEVFSDWLTYKQERREPYKPIGLKSLIAQIKKKSQEYGEEAVANLIRECMSSNWKGIIWDRLENQIKENQRNKKQPAIQKKDAIDQIRADMERMEKFRKQLKDEKNK